MSQSVSIYSEITERNFPELNQDKLLGNVQKIKQDKKTDNSKIMVVYEMENDNIITKEEYVPDKFTPYVYDTIHDITGIPTLLKDDIIDLKKIHRGICYLIDTRNQEIQLLCCTYNTSSPQTNNKNNWKIIKTQKYNYTDPNEQFSVANIKQNLRIYFDKYTKKKTPSQRKNNKNPLIFDSIKEKKSRDEVIFHDKITLEKWLYFLILNSNNVKIDDGGGVDIYDYNNFLTDTASINNCLYLLLMLRCKGYCDISYIDTLLLYFNKMKNGNYILEKKYDSWYKYILQLLKDWYGHDNDVEKHKKKFKDVLEQISEFFKNFKKNQKNKINDNGKILNEKKVKNNNLDKTVIDIFLNNKDQINEQKIKTIKDALLPRSNFKINTIPTNIGNSDSGYGQLFFLHLLLLLNKNDLPTDKKIKTLSNYQHKFDKLSLPGELSLPDDVWYSHQLYARIHGFDYSGYHTIIVTYEGFKTILEICSKINNGLNINNFGTQLENIEYDIYTFNTEHIKGPEIFRFIYSYNLLEELHKYKKYIYGVIKGKNYDDIDNITNDDIDKELKENPNHLKTTAMCLILYFQFLFGNILTNETKRKNIFKLLELCVTKPEYRLIPCLVTADIGRDKHYHTDNDVTSLYSFYDKYRRVPQIYSMFRKIHVETLGTNIDAAGEQRQLGPQSELIDLNIDFMNNLTKTNLTNDDDKEYNKWVSFMLLIGICFYETSDGSIIPLEYKSPGLFNNYNQCHISASKILFSSNVERDLFSYKRISYKNNKPIAICLNFDNFKRDNLQVTRHSYNVLTDTYDSLIQYFILLFIYTCICINEKQISVYLTDTSVPNYPIKIPINYESLLKLSDKGIKDLIDKHKIESNLPVGTMKESDDTLINNKKYSDITDESMKTLTSDMMIIMYMIIIFINNIYKGKNNKSPKWKEMFEIFFTTDDKNFKNKNISSIKWNTVMDKYNITKYIDSMTEKNNLINNILKKENFEVLIQYPNLFFGEIDNKDLKDENIDAKEELFFKEVISKILRGILTWKNLKVFIKDKEDIDKDIDKLISKLKEKLQIKFDMQDSKILDNFVSTIHANINANDDPEKRNIFDNLEIEKFKFLSYDQHSFRKNTISQVTGGSIIDVLEFNIDSMNKHQIEFIIDIFSKSVLEILKNGEENIRSECDNLEILLKQDYNDNQIKYIKLMKNEKEQLLTFYDGDIISGTEFKKIINQLIKQCIKYKLYEKLYIYLQLLIIFNSLRNKEKYSELKTKLEEKELQQRINFEKIRYNYIDIKLDSNYDLLPLPIDTEIYSTSKKRTSKYIFSKQDDQKEQIYIPPNYDQFRSKEKENEILLTQEGKENVDPFTPQKINVRKRKNKLSETDENVFTTPRPTPRPTPRKFKKSIDNNEKQVPMLREEISVGGKKKYSKKTNKKNRKYSKKTNKKNRKYSKKTNNKLKKKYTKNKLNKNNKKRSKRT